MPSERYSGPRPVAPPQAWLLRREVLRPEQPPEASRYPADDDPDAVHLGMTEQGRLVAVGSIFPEEGWRIRGMATLPEHRGRGLGSRILRGMLAVVARRGGGRVWCNARTTASAFYRRHGFVVEGDPFDLPGIGPHLRMALVAEPASRSEDDAAPSPVSEE